MWAQTYSLQAITTIAHNTSFIQLSFQTANLNQIKAISTQISPINTSHGGSALSQSTFIPSAQALHSLTCTTLWLDKRSFNSLHPWICSFLQDTHSLLWNVHFLLFYSKKPCTLPNIWLISIDFLIIQHKLNLHHEYPQFPVASHHFNIALCMQLATSHTSITAWIFAHEILFT